MGLFDRVLLRVSLTQFLNDSVSERLCRSSYGVLAFCDGILRECECPAMSVLPGWTGLQMGGGCGPFADAGSGSSAL